jgi:hypothetical protein
MDANQLNEQAALRLRDSMSVGQQAAGEAPARVAVAMFAREPSINKSGAVSITEMPRAR